VHAPDDSRQSTRYAKGPTHIDMYFSRNPNTRNKLRSTTLDTAEYGADDDGKDEAKVSLHAAAEEGSIDTMKSLVERGMYINACNTSNQ
jgi:ankyrin repeat protein